MKISVEEKKLEAVKRMKKIGIYPETISQFEREDYISRSEPPVGAYFWVEGDDLKLIREFEKEYNVPVYSVIRSYTTIGKLDSCLFVGDHKKEWELDREDLQHNQTIAYVINHDMPDCSEIGSIGYKLGMAAGLLRTW